MLWKTFAVAMIYGEAYGNLMQTVRFWTAVLIFGFTTAAAGARPSRNIERNSDIEEAVLGEYWPLSNTIFWKLRGYSRIKMKFRLPIQPASLRFGRLRRTPLIVSRIRP